FLRGPDGAYWTGWQFANNKHFPNERSSYTSAAIILAADALSAATGGNGLFRAAADPAAPAPDPGRCGCHMTPAQPSSPVPPPPRIVIMTWVAPSRPEVMITKLLLCRSPCGVRRVAG